MSRLHTHTHTHTHTYTHAHTHTHSHTLTHTCTHNHKHTHNYRDTTTHTRTHTTITNTQSHAQTYNHKHAQSESHTHSGAMAMPCPPGMYPMGAPPVGMPPYYPQVRPSSKCDMCHRPAVQARHSGYLYINRSYYICTQDNTSMLWTKVTTETGRVLHFRIGTSNCSHSLRVLELSQTLSNASKKRTESVALKCVSTS